MITFANNMRAIIITLPLHCIEIDPYRDALVKEKMTPIVNAFMLCGTEKLSYKVSELERSRIKVW